MLKIVLFVWSVGLCTCDVSLKARPSWNPYNSALKAEYGAPPQSVDVSKENIQLTKQTFEFAPSKYYIPARPPGQLRQSKTSPAVSLKMNFD